MKACKNLVYSKVFVLLQTKCFSKSSILKKCHIHIVLVHIYADLCCFGTKCICLKFLSSFLCSSKSFLNFRLFSTRLLINWFLKETCISHRFSYTVSIIIITAYLQPNLDTYRCIIYTEPPRGLNGGKFSQGL